MNTVDNVRVYKQPVEIHWSIYEKCNAYAIGQYLHAIKCDAISSLKVSVFIYFIIIFFCTRAIRHKTTTIKTKKKQDGFLLVVEDDDPAC